MDTAREITLRMQEVHNQRLERTVRWMLAKWVSGFEPSLVMRGGNPEGLCVLDDPTGTLVVKAPMRELQDTIFKVAFDMVGKTVK